MATYILGSPPFATGRAAAILLVASLATAQTPVECPCACDALQNATKQIFSSSTCLTTEILEELDLQKSDREGTSLRFEIHTWPSHKITTLVGAILARDVMGYTSEFTCAESDVNGLARITNGATDVSIEYQLETYAADAQKFVDTDLTVTDAGTIGYTIQGAFYVPQYQGSYYYATLAALGKLELAEALQASVTWWTSLQNPYIINMLAQQNDSSIVSNPYLTMKSNFTPPWCNPWNATGVGNNCFDIKSADSALDPALPQIITNLKLNATVSYWGTGLDGSPGLPYYSLTKLARGEPFVMKSAYVPARVFQLVALLRVNLPPWSQACYDTFATGGVNCDYPIISLRKMASPAVLPTANKDPYHDFGLFLRRFRITQAESDQMWVDSLGDITTSIVNNQEYNVACSWIKTNNATWKPWVSNTYSAPTRVTWQFSNQSKAAIMTFASIGLVTCAILAVLIATYRSHPLLKSISRNFSVLSLLGFGMLIGSSLLFTVDDPNKSVCTGRLWMPPLAVALAFSSLGAKTYRIYRIFTKTIENPMLLTDCYLLQITALVVSGVLVLLIAQYIDNPPDAATTIIEDGNTITTYHHCRFDSSWYFGIVGLLAFIVLFITKLAYDVREAPLQFNEARELGMTLYTAVIAGIIGIPMIAFFESRNEFNELQVSIGLLASLPPTIMVLIMYAGRTGYAIFGVTVAEVNEAASRKIDYTESKRTYGRGAASHSVNRDRVTVSAVRVRTSLPDGSPDITSSRSMRAKSVQGESRGLALSVGHSLRSPGTEGRSLNVTKSFDNAPRLDTDNLQPKDILGLK